jgi:hypothetical protein
MILTLTKVLVKPAVLMKSARNRRFSEMGFDSGGSILLPLGWAGTLREGFVGPG